MEISDHQLGSKSFFLDMYRFRYTADRVGYLLFEIQALAREFPDGRVLEIGCGPGIDLRQLSTAGFQTVAVDMTYNGLSLARQHLNMFDQTAQLVLANAERLPFDDNSFDCVWSIGVLHHVDDTHVAIDEVHRVLRPGGRALVVLYHKWSWLNFFSKVFKVPVEHAEKEAPIIKTYSVGEVRRLFHRFREVEVHVERPPGPVKKTRTGLKALLFNRVLCPCFKVLPENWGKAIGWHLVIRGIKVLCLLASCRELCLEI